jgi:hypothetical protein
MRAEREHRITANIIKIPSVFSVFPPAWKLPDGTSGNNA